MTTRATAADTLAVAGDSSDHAAARPRLTREKVLRAALDFVDAHGLAALSMHKLGAGLGVQGMSLYTHVASKDALLDGIVEAMTAEAEMPPADGADSRGAPRPPPRESPRLLLPPPPPPPPLVTPPRSPPPPPAPGHAPVPRLMPAGVPQ